MTDKQKFKFYFPAWRNCCLANEWHMVKGRLDFNPERLTDEGRKVMTFARQRAVTEKRGITLDDMRHGAHWLALGKDKSSAHLNNAEVDRVVCLFRVLQDPDDLDSRIKWEAYERGEDPGAVNRLDYIIKTIPDALARKISQDMIGTRMWEWATAQQKQILARRIAQYRKQKS